MINFCWFFFKWGLVLCVIGAVAAVPYFYRRVDEEIRRRIEARLAQHYIGLKVSVGSAELVAGQGIKVHDLTISEPGAEGPRAELAVVEEMFIACQTDMKELIIRDPVVTHVTVRRPMLYVTHRPDGTWSAAKLFPPPRFGNQSPETNDRKRHDRDLRSAEMSDKHHDLAGLKRNNRLRLCLSNRTCSRQAKNPRNAGQR